MPTSPRLHKLGFLVQEGKETALVVFAGEVLAVTFERPWGGFEGCAITVRRWATCKLLARHPWPGGMGCAIVKDGEIHIFGKTAWYRPGSKIIHSRLDPVTFAPSAPIDALLMNAPANPLRFYNTSVTADPNGFRMVVETTAGVYFARSADLDTWTWAGGQLQAGAYCGCPSIHHLNGVHHLTWLAHVGGGVYETRTAQSTDDCFTFIYGQPFLSPEPADGTNCSDVDLVELDGRVCGVYLGGDQTTYAHLCAWSYDGTMDDLFAKFA